MKKLLRYIAVLPIIAPFVIFVQVARIFVGKEKAVQLCAPGIIRIAKFFLGLAVPRIKTPADFDIFRRELKNKFWVLSPLFDFEVKEENEDLIKLNVRNCPFCELLSMAGMDEMNPHVCQGDWELAKENDKLWTFEREHEIGKGDTFCDHTYKRISS